MTYITIIFNPLLKWNPAAFMLLLPIIVRRYVHTSSNSSIKAAWKLFSHVPLSIACSLDIVEGSVNTKLRLIQVLHRADRWHDFFLPVILGFNIRPPLLCACYVVDASWKRTAGASLARWMAIGCFLFTFFFFLLLFLHRNFRWAGA